MKQLKLASILLGIAMLFFTSCEKEDTPTL
jgi:hypothetical protein